MKYVIADDLSGANDTGVKFMKRGYHTIVAITNHQSTHLVPDTIDVFVADTETRESEERHAREKVKRILQELQIDQDDFVYKKIDSTMRGNIGAEIEEIMKFLPKDICIFTPTFPSHQRTVIDSVLMVNQKPLGESEYSSGHSKQEECSCIPTILKKQANLSVGQIYLEDVSEGPNAIVSRMNELHRKGYQIIVLDSTTEKHLEDIFISGLRFSGTVLFSGSAGLANHIPINNTISDKPGRKGKNRKSPVIIVAGSRNSIVAQQISYLKNQSGLPEIKIDLEQIFTDKNKFLKNYTARAIEVINMHQDLLVYTDSPYNEKYDINHQLMAVHHLSFRELEIEIKKVFGKLTSEIIKNTNASNLILTGGDVALGVCETLQINTMNILDELLPGIPLTSADYKNRKLNIVTKAGGFGKANALYQLMNKLKND